MKRVLVFCFALLFLLSMAACSHESTAVSFAERDFSTVTQAKLYNCHNGQSTLITDGQSISELSEFIRALSGASAKEQEGFYEGTYTVTLLDAEENVIFEIGFGDSDVFYHENTRFDMAKIGAKEVIAFFSQYDAGGFEW